MQRRLIENKQSIAIIIALIILLFTALSDILISRLQKQFLEKDVETNRLLDSLLATGGQEIILQGKDSQNRIAVLPIKGIIETNPSRIMQELSVVEQLDQIIEDPSVRGLLLEIDSPGGTVYESARIWEKIKEIQEIKKIPIYSSMGSVAASGGYYVAAPSDKIFAAAETITGSIGVIADYVNITELEAKLGIKHEVIKSGEFKDIGSMSREMSKEEREINQKQVDEFFDKFIQIIAEGRKMSTKEVLALADGRVYTGSEALENGLIDELGYYEDALQTMIVDLELEDPEVYQHIGEQPLWNHWLGLISQKFIQNNKKTSNVFEADSFKYMEKHRSEGNLPRFYYLYGGI